MEEIIHSMGMISICDECYKHDVESWLACECEDQGFQLMNDEEVIEFVLDQAANTEEEENGKEVGERGYLKP
uniref:Uncharacterized protein n=1 Tax=Trichuris muris TaxID=70415 RepID=A0A5S6QHJ0_TRIMR